MTIGVSQMMWSSDYPHSGADWPNSWKSIENHFAGVPEDEKTAHPGRQRPAPLRSPVTR